MNPHRIGRFQHALLVWHGFMLTFVVSAWIPRVNVDRGLVVVKQHPCLAPLPHPYIPTWTSTTRHSSIQRAFTSWLLASSATNEQVSTSSSPSMEDDNTTSWRPCFYKSPATGRWKQRWELSELTIGQELPDAIVVQELLKGKTGPKLFVDCGVGRYRKPNKKKISRMMKQDQDDGLDRSQKRQQDWKIVTGMLRLERYGKTSVIQKRASRLRQKPYFPVYVSKIRLENDEFEVTLTQDDALRIHMASGGNNSSNRTSVSSLHVGQELDIGTIVRLEPYGALIDVGANRHGLLHIRQIAALYGRYIDGRQGLEQYCGLKKGTKVKGLQLLSQTQKRLFLDFNDCVKEQAAAERAATMNSKQRAPTDRSSSSSSAKSAAIMAAGTSTTATSRVNRPLTPEEEEAAWASYYETLNSSTGTDPSTNQDADEDDDDDDYEDDEDREIEDAFGLGSY